MSKIVLGVLTVLFLLSACTPSDSAPLPAALQATPTIAMARISTVEVTSTPASGGVSLENDECDNPYYPVVNGAWWKYNISTGATPTHSMTASDKTFSITVDGGKDVFTFNGSCTDDGIILLEVPGVSSSYKGQDGGSHMTTTNDDGVTLPNDVQIGDDWTQSISVVATSEDVSFSAHLTTDYKAIGYETVSTPIGPINALKVEQTASLNMGNEMTMDIHGYIWYGLGIGVVKNSVDDAYEATLLTYNIPQP